MKRKRALGRKIERSKFYDGEESRRSVFVLSLFSFHHSLLLVFFLGFHPDYSAASALRILLDAGQNNTVSYGQVIFGGMKINLDT